MSKIRKFDTDIIRNESIEIQILNSIILLLYLLQRVNGDRLHVDLARKQTVEDVPNRVVESVSWTVKLYPTVCVKDLLLPPNNVIVRSAHVSCTFPAIITSNVSPPWNPFRKSLFLKTSLFLTITFPRAFTVFYLEHSSSRISINPWNFISPSRKYLFSEIYGVCFIC